MWALLHKTHKLHMVGLTTYIGLLSERLTLKVGVDMFDGSTSDTNGLGKSEVSAKYFGLAWNIGKDMKYYSAHLLGSHGRQYTNSSEDKKLEPYSYSAYGLRLGVNLW